MDPSRILGLFIAWPALALVPAAVFGFLYLRSRSRLALVASLAWLAYVPYEMGMKFRILCSGECNIRVDLLMLYPLLALLSVVGLVVVARARRGRVR